MRLPKWRGFRKQQRKCEETEEAARSQKKYPLEVLVSDAQVFKSVPDVASAVNNTLKDQTHPAFYADELNALYKPENIPSWITVKDVTNRRDETVPRKFYDLNAALDYVLERTKWETPSLDRYGQQNRDASGNLILETKKYSPEIGILMVTLALAAHHHQSWVGVVDGYLHNLLGKSQNFDEKELFHAVGRKLLAKEEYGGGHVYLMPTRQLAEMVTKS